MRALAGFLVVGAITGALWMSGFYSHNGTGPAVSPVTTSQPYPAASHKAHHLRGHRLRMVRLLPAGGGGNSGSGQ